VRGSGLAIRRIAVLRDAQGLLLGEVLLEQTPHGVLLRGELTGLPVGPHGLHFHERGRCEPDFDAAGGHYNPGGRAHGLRDPAGPHAGDLPNLHMPPGGRVHFEMLNPRISLRDGQAPLLDDDGTALLIHADEDDHRTDPSGDSGPPIACGVVTNVMKQ